MASAAPVATGAAEVTEVRSTLPARWRAAGAGGLRSFDGLTGARLEVLAMTRDSLRSERDVVEFQASAPRVVLPEKPMLVSGDSRSARKPIQVYIYS